MSDDEVARAHAARKEWLAGVVVDAFGDAFPENLPDGAGFDIVVRILMKAGFTAREAADTAVRACEALLRAVAAAKDRL